MPPLAVSYVGQPLHVLNMGRIPHLMAERGWRFACLHGFSKDLYPQPLSPLVEYYFDVPVAALGTFAAELFLTPALGISGPFPHSAKRVHFLHSLSSIDGVYRDSAFDDMDVIVCAGHHHMQEFPKLGEARGWNGKTFLPAGYPKLDQQRREIATARFAPPGDRPTVVFAPTVSHTSAGAMSVLGNYGEEIVARLIGDGIRVIFRPHIHSWEDDDRHTIARTLARFNGHPLLVVDRSANYSVSYAHSDAIITDMSGTGFTFAFTFTRPAIFFAPNRDAEAGLTGIQFENRADIGYVARTLDELVPMVRTAYSESKMFTGKIAEFRNSLLFNLGASEEYFANSAEALAA